MGAVALCCYGYAFEVIPTSPAGLSGQLGLIGVAHYYCIQTGERTLLRGLPETGDFLFISYTVRCIFTVSIQSL